MTDQRTFSWDRRTFIGAGAAATALALGGVPLKILGQDRRLATTGGTVKTRSGSVRGLLKDGVQQFWCVPYGAPTGGANRFMPPQKPASWSGVKDLFEITFGAPLAPGAEEPSPVVTALNRKGPESEDCLSVNVFTPGLDNRARPVMVWMHGGGFTAGSGNYLLYDGTNLAKKEDVVVVSVNHRLNLFGFLHLADLGGEKWAGATNAGIQDLVAALAWVHDNIEAFGGDPSRVTIFGQSGGGGKTTTVMAMPSAKGLFHRAIAQSGSAFRGQTASDATDGAERYLAKLGLKRDQLDKLHELDTKTLQNAYYAEPRIERLANGPVIDGKILPRHQWDPTAPSYSANVPLIAGSVETENGWVGPPPSSSPTPRCSSASRSSSQATTRLRARSCSGSTSGRTRTYGTRCCGSPRSPTTRGAGTLRSSAASSRSSARPRRICTTSTGSRRFTTTGWALTTRSTFRSCSTTWTSAPR